MEASAADVFVSYKAEDRRRVKPLVEALEAEGYSVWWDAQIGGGAAWRHTIETELNAASCVIVVWSNRSVGLDGAFVQDEATRAQERHVYIPVTIDKVHVPLGFGETQALPLTGWRGNRSDPRFQAVLTAVQRLTGHTEQGPRPPTRKAPVMSRRVAIGGIAGGTAAALGLGAWLWLRPTAADASDSIAVLPFENLSGDPSQAYFSDGLAEELRNALARIPRLKVVARTSSEAVRNDDAKTAAQKLGVASILTGSVRRSPDLIRVSAQLVDGRSGLERWSQTFDRPFGDVLAIQTNIAENVADALSIQLAGATKAALTLGGTENPAALDLYLQADPGRSSGSPEGILHSIAQLDDATQLDPNYAQAYARKAMALSTYGGTYTRSLADGRTYFAQGTAAAKRAIELAPRLPEGHAALSFLLRNELRLRDSDSEIRLAITLPGAAATTWSSYGVFLVQDGAVSEVLNAVARATQLDPLNATVFANKSWTLLALHQYQPAIEAAQAALRIDPSRANARRFVGYALIMLGRYDEAIAEFSKLPADSVQAQAGRAMIAAFKGDLKASDQLLVQMEQENGDASNYQYAQVYAQRRDADQAIHFLEKGLATGDPGMASVRADPFFDPIRADPRFGAILRRLGLPA